MGGTKMMLLTNREACEILGVSPNTVRTLVKRRQLPAIRIGGHLRFRREDLLNYIEKNTITAE